jgi:hypothetical protein
MTTVREETRGTAPAAGASGLIAWAEESGRRRAKGPARGGLRFVFYGRVSTEDWQDPGAVPSCEGHRSVRCRGGDRLPGRPGQAADAAL